MALTRRAFIRNTTALAAGALLPGCFEDPVEGKVIVIGAGLAGIAAATRLQSAGATVTALEGRDRIGGRAMTVDAGGRPADLGASWLHGPDGNPLTPLLNDQGIVRIPTDWDDACLLDGQEEVDAEETAMAVVADLRRRKGRTAGESVADGLEAVLAGRALDPDVEDQVRRIIWSNVALEYATELDDLSLASWDEDDAFDGGDDLVVGGWQPIAEALAASLDIRLGHAVSGIEHGDGVVVHGPWGELEADAVVITAPLGVLKAGSIAFDPPLPAAHQAALDRLAMGTMRKVLLAFDDAFWPDCSVILDVDQAWEFHVLPGDRLMALTCGEEAIKPDPAGRALDALTAITGVRRTPRASATSSWHDDPFSMGSYSHMPPGADLGDHARLAVPISAGCVLAGEATHDRYPSTLHGAWLSGLRAADQIKHHLA